MWPTRIHKSEKLNQFHYENCCFSLCVSWTFDGAQNMQEVPLTRLRRHFTTYEYAVLMFLPVINWTNHNECNATRVQQTAWRIQCIIGWCKEHRCAAVAQLSLDLCYLIDETQWNYNVYRIVSNLFGKGSHTLILKWPPLTIIQCPKQMKSCKCCNWICDW